MDDFFDSFKKPSIKLIHCTKVVHFRKQDFDIFIARPSKWGCPFTVIKDRNTLAEFICETRSELFEKYQNWLEYGAGKHLLNDLHELKDKRLGCWCKNDKGGGKKCHGDILVKLIEKYCK